MANRMFKPVEGSLTQGITCLTGSWEIGSTGAVTVSALGFDVGTISAPGAGSAQTITLEDKYDEFLGAQFTFHDSGTLSAYTTGFIELTAEDVAGAKTVQVRYIEVNAGNLTALGTIEGKKVYCVLWLKNSGVG